MILLAKTYRTDPFNVAYRTGHRFALILQKVLPPRLQFPFEFDVKFP